MGGANSGTEWAIEGRRLVPLLPRLVPQTAFTAIADKVANMAMTEGAKLPLPVPPIKKRMVSRECLNQIHYLFFRENLRGIVFLLSFSSY